jgi:hypothetical protein
MVSETGERTNLCGEYHYSTQRVHAVAGFPLDRFARMKTLAHRFTSRFVLPLLVAASVGPAPVLCAATSPKFSDTAPAEYHQMDFWIGDWDTFETDGSTTQSQARARITPIAEGAAIHELYEQNDGLIGDSILSYDPVRKHWQQTWVTNRGAIMVITGHWKDGTMVLEGEVHLSSGATVLQRISWKVQDGGVREWAVMSKDGGKTWTPAFDVLFRKRAPEAVQTAR